MVLRERIVSNIWARWKEAISAEFCHFHSHTQISSPLRFRNYLPCKGTQPFEFHIFHLIFHIHIENATDQGMILVAPHIIETILLIIYEDDTRTTVVASFPVQPTPSFKESPTFYPSYPRIRNARETQQRNPRQFARTLHQRLVARDGPDVRGSFFRRYERGIMIPRERRTVGIRIRRT